MSKRSSRRACVFLLATFALSLNSCMAFTMRGFGPIDYPVYVGTIGGTEAIVEMWCSPDGWSWEEMSWVLTLIWLIELEC